VNVPSHGALSANVIGVSCAALASVAFTLNDAAIKFLSGDYPLHEIVLVRATVAMLITLVIIMPLEGGFQNLKTRRPGLHVIRGLLLVMANMTFFLSLATIPLSEATAIFFIAPLLITIFSVAFLGEKVGPWRWGAVIAGLAGAIIMLRPGSASFQPTAFLPLAAAAGYAGVHTLTRRIGLTEKASTMAFYIQLTFIIVSAAFGLAVGDGQYQDIGGPSLHFLLREWIWPPAEDLLVMLGIGVASASGGYLISQAYRTCEAALVAPFEYLALVLAIVWGVTFFGEWPDTMAWAGIGLILFGGLFVFWREALHNRQVASRRPMPRHR
jgi:drug/metabolite transporter (DMT)-like permease